MYEAMPYFKEDKAISSKHDCFKLPSNVVTIKLWEEIISFLQKYDYSLPKLPKIRSNAKDHFDQEVI